MRGICKYLDEVGAVVAVAILDREGKPDRVSPEQYAAAGFQPPLDSVPPCGGRPAAAPASGAASS
jgi:hypothetical protein